MYSLYHARETKNKHTYKTYIHTCAVMNFLKSISDNKDNLYHGYLVLTTLVRSCTHNVNGCPATSHHELGLSLRLPISVG